MMNKKESILIVLIAGIGDLILASKSIRAIRNGSPDDDIQLLTSTEAYPIAQNYDYLDHVWAFPIRELRKNKSHIFKVVRLIHKLRKLYFSNILNLYRVVSYRGSFKMGLLFLLIRAKQKVGHDNKGFGLFLN